MMIVGESKLCLAPKEQILLKQELISQVKGLQLDASLKRAIGHRRS